MRTRNLFLATMLMLVTLVSTSKASEKYYTISLFITEINNQYTEALQHKLLMYKKMDQTNAQIILKVDTAGNVNINNVKYENAEIADEIKKIVSQVPVNKAPLEAGYYSIKVNFKVQ